MAIALAAAPDPRPPQPIRATRIVSSPAAYTRGPTAARNADPAATRPVPFKNSRRDVPLASLPLITTPRHLRSTIYDLRFETLASPVTHSQIVNPKSEIRNGKSIHPIHHAEPHPEIGFVSHNCPCHRPSASRLPPVPPQIGFVSHARPSACSASTTLIWWIPGGSGKRGLRSLPMACRRRHEPSACLALAAATHNKRYSKPRFRVAAVAGCAVHTFSHGEGVRTGPGPGNWLCFRRYTTDDNLS